ncbi:MAG: hypothetical protein LBB88_02080 [Planctomycetaceae bacterium]|nr:hypothetical protein [Planctomycetaceae bacterium]
MSNPFYRCLRQRDLSAKGRLPDLLPPTDGQILRNMSYNLPFNIYQHYQSKR